MVMLGHQRRQCPEMVSNHPHHRSSGNWQMLPCDLTQTTSNTAVHKFGQGHSRCNRRETRKCDAGIATFGLLPRPGTRLLTATAYMFVPFLAMQHCAQPELPWGLHISNVGSGQQHSHTAGITTHLGDDRSGIYPSALQRRGSSMAR